MIIASCANSPVEKSKNSDSNSLPPDRTKKVEVGYRQLVQLNQTGDFDGDKNLDTIIVTNYSRLTKHSIDSFPLYEWEDLQKFFFDQQSDVTITMAGCQDTIHMGEGFGVYCLINMGDNNRDKKDEIAFVVDRCDYGNVNSCFIYTICNGKWQELNTIDIHESAFLFQGDTVPIFKEIKGFLEMQNNKWCCKLPYNWTS